MSLDAVKEAQKQLKKQRKQESRVRKAAAAQTTQPPANDTEDASDSSDGDFSRGLKRKRKADKDTKAGKAKKRGKSNENAPLSSTSQTNTEQHAEDIGIVLAPQPKHISKQWKKSKRRQNDKWLLSGSVGGRLLPLDPIFTHDEKFLLLATRSTVLVYSTANSLLYRRIEVDDYGLTTSLALSPVDNSRLYVGTSSGYLLHLDWYNGKIERQQKVGSHITNVTACEHKEGKQDMLYFTDIKIDVKEDPKGKRGSRLCRCAAIALEDQVKVLLDVSKPLRDFQILAGGKMIIAVSERHIFLGFISDPDDSNQGAHSTWHQVESTEPVVSICTRQRLPTSSPGKTSSRGSAKVPHIDLAVGTIQGSIFVYEDFATKLTGSGSGKKGINSAVRPTPKILHWHRGHVNTLKWSLDGNYLISGGSETVLVLWQIKTGKRQDLPHLTSAINCLTVSPTGTSYGIQLADNSVMVLLTADLQPTAHISGLQAQISASDQDMPQLRTVASEQAKNLDEFAPSKHVPAVVNPLFPNQVLLAVPASQSKMELSSTPRSAPFLQTFDLSLAHSMARQALTRNNATHTTTGPESNLIGEPDVQHIQTSHDGKWLATVEEWLPPRSDLDYVANNQDDVSDERALRLEIYLKFWKWDEKEQIWALDTRIDSPHLFADGVTPARVQCLRADPVRAEFVTSGEDGVARVWRATTRYRDAVAVKGQGGTALTVWSCRFATEASGPILDIEEGFAGDRRATTSKVGYSEDGSVIAACYEDAQNPTNGTVHLVDATTGAIQQSRPDLFVSGLKDVGFLDRYLVIVADSLIVYDLVDDELSYEHQFNTDGAQLAVNTTSGNFAIVMRTKKTNRCRVVVFDPKSPVPVYDSPKLDWVTALLSLPSSAGFIVLNSYAEARTLTLSTSVSAPVLQRAVVNGEAALQGMEALPEPPQTTQEEGETEEVEMAEVEDDIEEDDDQEDDEDDGKRVVRPQQLAALFEDRPSFAMPPVREMFDAIVGLYGRRSKSRHRKSDAVA